MSRKRYSHKAGVRRSPITPQIIQGAWSYRDYPGSAVFSANCRDLARAFRAARPRARKQPLADLFTIVETRSQILHDARLRKHRVVSLLAQLGPYTRKFVREPDDWEPGTTRPFDQLRELMVHLFERYPTPAFFERAWWPVYGGRDWLGFGWYVHIAAGGSVRTAPRIPASLTRRAAHAMMRAPNGVTPRQAVRWGQLEAMGIADQLFCFVRYSSAADDFDHDAVWLPLFSKLAAARLPWQLLYALVDYISYEIAEAPAASPFSIKRRSLTSLVRATQRWYEQTAGRPLPICRMSKLKWTPLDGVEPMEGATDGRRWRIRELCSGAELQREGVAMSHCVATYVPACHRGAASIWSMEISHGQHIERVTVRLQTGIRQIAEARGFANAPISRFAAAQLRHWAAANDLGVGNISVAS